MYNPTTRLLTILELLQSRGTITGPELAAKLEVEVRSIRRYITMLRDMGIPVETERGRYGAYMLRPGYRLPPLMFNEDEILAVVLGLMIARKLSLTDSTGIESAAAKIERVLPPELRQRVWALQGALMLDLAAGDVETPGQVVAAVSLAAHQQHSLSIVYRTPKGEETKRIIDPYGVVYHAGLWYTTAYCHLRHDLRVFRLDRILALETRDSPFDRPALFDPLAYVLESIARLPGGYEVQVIFQATPEDVRRFIPPDTALVERTAEGTLMQCFTGNLDWLARVLARTGLTFTILQPDALRDELRKLAEHLLTLAEK